MAMTCFTSWRFIKAGKYGQAKQLLKHLENREGNRIDRHSNSPWYGYGLGEDWQSIVNSLIERQMSKVLLRSLVVRPPQKLIAQLKELDPERWAARFELLVVLVERIMDAEMERSGISWPGYLQPMELPYSFVIHTHPDRDGVESPHAHIIVAASNWHGERPFTVYRSDVQRTRAVAEQELEALFELDRLRTALTPVAEEVSES
jgi:hypothetical protein